MMKKTYFIVGLLLCLVGSVYAQGQEEIHWMTLDEALAAQKVVPKKIMMDAFTLWCGPCKLMDKRTFHNKDVVNYVNKHFYAVKFNAEGNDTIHYQNETYTNPRYNPALKYKRNYTHGFAKVLGIRGYPTLVFFDEKSNVIAPVVGYRTPHQLEIYLKMIASNDYKKVTTQEAWTAYQKNFDYTFEN